MRHAFAAAMACTVIAGSATAGVLSFDDIPGGSIQGRYGDVGTYGGFAFSDNLKWIDTVGSSYDFGAVSGDFTLLNLTSGAGIVTASDGSDFIFGGLWAKAWGTPADSGGADTLLGTLAGLKNGEEVWSVATALNGSFRYFGPQAGTIDQLSLGFGNHFIADELEMTNADDGETTLIVPVVVPASLSLLFSGIFGLFLLQRIARRRARRRRRQAFC